MTLREFKKAYPSEWRTLPQQIEVSPGYLDMIAGGIREPHPERALLIYQACQGMVELHNIRPSLALKLRELEDLGLLPLN